MNDHIYEYALDTRDEKGHPHSDRWILHLPKDSEILSVAERHGLVVVYVLAEKERLLKKELETYTFLIKGTGVYVGNFKRKNYTFLGTVNFGRDRVVLHVFYRKGT